MDRLFERLRSGTSAANSHLMLGLIVLLIPLQAFATEDNLVKRLVVVGYLLVFLSAFGIIARSSRTKLTTVVLLFAWGCGEVISRVFNGATVFDEQLNEVTNVLMVGWLIVHLVIEIAHMKRVTLQVISVSLSAYLMIGVWFGSVYQLIYSFDYEAFQPLSELLGWHPPLKEGVGSGLRPERDDLFYYSFVTMTSLGYGDVLPVSALARSMSILEVVAGQFYLAVIIARQVGLYIASGLTASKSD